MNKKGTIYLLAIAFISNLVDERKLKFTLTDISPGSNSAKVKQQVR